MIILSFVAGLAWVVIYKTIHAFRTILERGRLACAIEDLVLAVSIAVGTYMFMFRTCGGLVRGYNYIALLLGIIFTGTLFKKVETAVLVRKERRRILQEKKDRE
ncbi:MAG: spore cortex biosynthesis protein YabQ [Lachnospiraceae bacterium]